MTCKCTSPPKHKHAWLGLVSMIVLVLLPKCPLCFVGYAALFGIGLSVTAAVLLRQALVIACVLVLVLLVVRVLVRRAHSCK
ncbi:MAG TPA: hypothetical protein VIV11_36845 [Kofleriaceae bacterium]